MAPRRKQAQKLKINVKAKDGVLKASQRFIIQKNGKLSKTNLHALFSDPKTWNSLTTTQQRHILDSINVSSLFGEGHPMQIEDGMGDYINYFTIKNPLARRTTPDRENNTDVVVEAKLEYLPMKDHLDKFKNLLKDGYFDPKWVARAEAKSRMRARGDYDDFWQYDEDTKLSEESKTKVALVKERREARRRAGLE